MVMIDLNAPEMTHWINIYAVIFSVLILSLAINFSWIIKNIINRILLIIVLTGVIRFSLNWFVFPEASLGYTQQEEIASFIYQGFDKNLFSGPIPFCISVIALIILIGRLIYTRKFFKIH